jgi:signal transduction histidine kinase/CheY-like chemotaxis protein
MGTARSRDPLRLSSSVISSVEVSRLSRPKQIGDGTSPNAPPGPGSDEERLTYPWKLAESRLRRLDAFVCDLSGAATVEGVGRAVLAAGVDAIGADLGTLWSIAGLTATMVARAPEIEAARRQTIALTTSSPITQAVISHEPVFVGVRDGRGARHTGVPPKDLSSMGANAFACLPLICGGTVRAVVGFAFASAHVFEPGERELLILMARQAAIAFQRALDHTERTSTARRIQGLYEITDALAEAQTPREVADVTVRLGAQAIDAWGGALWLVQPDGFLTIESVHNLPDRHLADWTRIAPEAPLPIWRVVRSGRSLWIEDRDDLARGAPELVELQAVDWPSAFVMLPLHDRQGCTGVVTFTYGAAEGHVFSEDERGFLRALVRTCEHALDRARLFAAAERGRREAELASANKDKFLAMLSHELRNPLAAMVAAMDLVKLGDGHLGRELTVLDRHLGHLAHLVGALLDVARITHGKITLERKAVDVSSALGYALDTARPLLDAARHQVSISVPENLLVDADRERLSQVLANLILNAAKYTPVGGRIEIAAVRDGSYVRIIVRDNGVGIAPCLLPRVFDLFVQGERGRDRREGGLGVGLTIVRAIVELHGGTVRAESDGPGQGATFVVEWPRATSDTATAKMAALPRPDTRRLRVLIVDDDRDAADLIGELVRELGHDVLVAHDAPTALRHAEESGPHVALVDVGLPEMDGYQLAQRLRAMPGLQTTPLVALASDALDSDLEQARQAGFSHRLPKPVDRVALAALLPLLG